MSLGSRDGAGCVGTLIEMPSCIQRCHSLSPTRQSALPSSWPGASRSARRGPGLPALRVGHPERRLRLLAASLAPLGGGGLVGQHARITLAVGLGDGEQVVVGAGPWGAPRRLAHHLDVGGVVAKAEQGVEAPRRLLEHHLHRPHPERELLRGERRADPLLALGLEGHLAELAPLDGEAVVDPLGPLERPQEELEAGLPEAVAGVDPGAAAKHGEEPLLEPGVLDKARGQEVGHRGEVCWSTAWLTGITASFSARSRCAARGQPTVRLARRAMESNIFRSPGAT